MPNDYFLHFTAEKERNIGKDKLKHGNAANIRGFSLRY